MRIAAAQLSHETNVFSRVTTDLAAFERSGLLFGGNILERERGTNSAFGGFIAASEQVGFALLPIMSVWATPSGMVTAEAISWLLDELTRRLRELGSIDGVLLALHGAMVTESDADGDALILESVRAAAGEYVPIVATLDLHANISPRMIAAASALIGYDTYPHVDMAERAAEAAELIRRIIAGEARPVASICKPPMLPTSQRMMTAGEPMRSLIALAHEKEHNARVLNVTVAGGFPASDMPEAGFTALVTTDGDEELAARLAREVAREAWRRREQFLGGVASFEEAAEAIRTHDAAGGKPLLLVDIGDNPWSGSPGDSAELLRFLLAQGVANAALAMIVDPQSVERCIAAGVGNDVHLQLGGKTDELHGPPLPVHGYVRLIGDGRYVNEGPMMAGLSVDIGPSVVLLVEEIEVLVTSKAETPIDLNVFRAHGIEPSKRRLIALKGKGHFRAAFEPIADRVILVEGPGISGSDLRRLPLRNVRRPIWPLDPEVTFD